MPTKLDTRLTLKVNGVPFADKDLDDLIELTVDTDYYLPAMFDIILDDDFNKNHAALTYADGSKFKLGAPVSITLESAMDIEHASYKALLIEGEITSLEPEFGSDGRARYHVRGYDKAHRLISDEKMRVFGSGMPGSVSEQPMVSKIAQEAGLSSNVDASGLSGLNYAYVLQFGQTDWDFLWERARRIGYQVYVEGNSLCFKKASAPRLAGTPIELEWTKDLTSFEPRVSVMGQAVEAMVTGWDPNKKQKVSGKCTRGSLSTVSSLGLASQAEPLIKKVYKKSSTMLLGDSGFDASIAKAAADAILSESENSLIQASGFLQHGDPRIIAGCQVKIKGVGTNFSGTYYVTRARHTIVNSAYQVQFDVASTAQTLSGLLEPGGDDDWQGSRIYGVVIGLVTNNNDTDNLGRVKVKFPWMPADESGAELESNWARVAAMGAGKDRGMVFLPEVNDEVLVAFENGNVNAPFVIGGLWNKMDTQPVGSGGGLVDSKEVKQRLIRTRTGHQILFDDSKGNEQILIEDKSKENSILIDTAKNTITVKAKTDIVFEAGKNFTVKAQGDITLQATGAVTIDSKKSVSIKAVQEAIMKAGTSQVAIKPSGAELSGTLVDVKANGKVSVSGSAMAEIKGGLVKIN